MSDLLRAGTYKTAGLTDTGSFQQISGKSSIAEREPAFLNVKLHAARFRVCVGLLADRWVAAAVIKQPFLQGGVVGADMASVLSFYPEMASVIKAPSPLKLGLSGKKKAPQS